MWLALKVFWDNHIRVRGNCEGWMGVKPRFDVQYLLRILLIVAVFSLNLLLSSQIGLNNSLLVVNVIAIISTLTIWRFDGLLKIDFRLGYLAYYLTLLAASIIVFPSHTDLILSLIYRNGFREEVLFRFFMVGIFLRYNTADAGDQKKLLYAILASNLLFMAGHPYNWIGLVSVFAFGVVFTLIYVLGGLPSAIIAHTLHNFYQTQDITMLSLLLLLPLIMKYASQHNLVNRLKKQG